MAAASTGDFFDEGFTSTYTGLYRELFRYAVFVMGVSEKEADDLVQNAFAKFWMRKHSVGQPRPWLYETVENACRSHLRQIAAEERRFEKLLGGFLGRLTRMSRGWLRATKRRSETAYDGCPIGAVRCSTSIFGSPGNG